MTPQTKAQRPARSPSRAREKTAADRRAFDASRVNDAIETLRSEGAKSFTDPDSASDAESIGNALVWSAPFRTPEQFARLAFECFEQLNARRMCALLDRTYNLFPPQWDTLADFRSHAQRTGNPIEAAALAWGEHDPAARFAHNGFYVLVEKSDGARAMWEYITTGLALEAETRGHEVRDAAREVLREVYALRDANYFRNHPTDTGALSVACAALEAALHEKQNHEVSK